MLYRYIKCRISDCCSFTLKLHYKVSCREEIRSLNQAKIPKISSLEASCCSLIDSVLCNERTESGG